MARVVYGGVVTELIGSIGGLTFQSNASGKICRLKPVKSKNLSLKQSISANAFTSLIASWWCLPIAAKNQWQTYADAYLKYDKWGTEKKLTGYNWYLSINSNRLLIDASILSVPPTHSLPPAVPNNYIQTSLTDVRLIFNPEVTIASHSLLIYTTKPIFTSSTSFRKDLRLTKVINDGVFNTLSIKSDWETAHSLSFPPVAGNYSFNIGVLIQIMDNESGIASIGTYFITNVISNVKGIGSMAIGSSFIVS